MGIDETVLQVHREDGRSDTTNSYMWVIRGGTVERPILLYMYRETRSADFLKKYLKWYNGIIQTDGYTSYDAHFRGNENILHAGCLAHARREFEKFWKAIYWHYTMQALMVFRCQVIIIRGIVLPKF